MRQKLIPLVALVLALTAGCEGGIPLRQDSQETRDRYMAYAGPPVDQLTWMGSYSGWEALGRDQLVLFTGVSDAYLLKVWAPCDLRFVVDRIGLTTTSHTVYARLDSIVVQSRGMGPMRCPIEEIRKIDYRQMRADLRTQAQASKAAPQAAQ